MRKNMISRLTFWAALAFATTMALLPHPPQIPGQPGDKVQHIVAFLVLTALAVNAYRQTPVLLLGVALSGLGASIEFLQMIPALHRDAQLSDWVADTTAIIAVLFVTGAVRRWERIDPVECISPRR